MVRRLALTTAATIMGLLPGGLTATAAASATAGVATTVIHRPINVRSIHNDNVSSTNWSGYAVQSASQFTQVSGTWVQPTATCNKLVGSTYAAFWVGIDGYSTSSVEQLGTDSDCSRSTPKYYAWWEMYPAGSVDISTSTYPVSPGDTLTGSVTRSGTNYTLSLHSSRGWTFSTTQSGSDANGSAEWIAEAPSLCTIFACRNANLTNFGTVTFSSSTAATGGSAAPISSFTADSGPHDITMTTTTGTTRAQPSALASGGEGFTDTWHHA